MAAVTRMIASPLATVPTISSSSSSSLPIRKAMAVPPFPGAPPRRAHSLQIRQRIRGLPRPCSASQRPNGGSGESDSEAVLYAFILGIAGAMNEKLGSLVGELWSLIGLLLAVLQKLVMDLQEEFQVEAKRAKEEAAQEAM